MNLPPFKLERYFAKYEFSTEYLLCSSDCEAMSIADLLAFEPEAAEKFQNVWLGYTESQGSPSLRAEIEYRAKSAEGWERSPRRSSKNVFESVG